MATQKEKGHDSDAPPKLQQLPGRSSNNKLQGRLYSNAGRGYDRESLQKMSAEGGRSLVTPLEKQDVTREPDDSSVEPVVTAEATQQESKNNERIKKYISGALLFLTGVIVGNVAIPLLTSKSDAPLVEPSIRVDNSVEKSPVEATENEAPISSITSITPITSITGGAESEQGCDIAALKEESAGCLINDLKDNASDESQTEVK